MNLLSPTHYTKLRIFVHSFTFIITFISFDFVLYIVALVFAQNMYVISLENKAIDWLFFTFPFFPSSSSSYSFSFLYVVQYQIMCLIDIYIYFSFSNHYTGNLLSNEFIKMFSNNNDNNESNENSPKKIDITGWHTQKWDCHGESAPLHMYSTDTIKWGKGK